jgi:MFS family permease
MNRQERSAASAIGSLYLIRMLGLFMVLPVLPLLSAGLPGEPIQTLAGVTPLLVGVAIGIYGLSQAILQIPFGLMSDRFGRKPVIAVGLCIFVVGSFIAGAADDIWGVILGRFLQGCGAIASTLLALMSDLTRLDQRSKSMAIIGIAIASSFGLSLILGPLVANVAGLAGIFNLSGLLGLAGLVLLAWLIPTPTIMTTNLNSAFQARRLGLILNDLGLWRLNVSIFFLHYLLVSAFSVFPAAFAGTGRIGTDEHAFYYFVLLGTSFVLMAPLMWMIDRVRDIRPVLVLVVGLCFLSFLLLAVSSLYSVVLAGVALFFMGFNLLEVTLPAQVSKFAQAGSRGTAMGVYTTCQFLGIFAGGIVSGWVLQVWDVAMLMYVDLAIVALWLMICFTFPRLGDWGSRTIQLGILIDQTAQQRMEELLLIDGVIDAVIIESEGVAYLKVDEQIFADEQLDDVVGSSINKNVIK